MPPTIVYVHDDPEAAHRVAARLVAAGYRRQIRCTYGRYVVDLLRQTSPDLVLLDLHHVPPAGWGIFEEIVRYVDAHRIPLLACGVEPSRSDAAGAMGWVLGTPCVPDAVAAQVAQVLSV